MKLSLSVNKLLYRSSFTISNKFRLNELIICPIHLEKLRLPFAELIMHRFSILLYVKHGGTLIFFG
jgi:hypothetical protein